MRCVVNFLYRVSIPPLLFIAFALILGIWNQSLEYGAINFVNIASLILGILLMLCSFYKKNATMQQIAYIILAFFIGTYVYKQKIKHHLNFYQYIGNAPFDIEATVTNLTPNKTLLLKNCITLQLKKIKINNGSWKDTSDRLCVYTNNIHNIMVGDSIEIYGLVGKKPSSSFSQYLIKENIMVMVHANNMQYTIIYRPSWSLSRWRYMQKKRLLTSLEQKLAPQAFIFFSSLFLGNRTWIKDKIQQTNELFKRWGISHFLARSGLHLAIFTLIWLVLFSFIPLSWGIKQILLLLIGIIYFFLTWPTVSFMRAFILFLLYKTCTALKVPFHFLHLLSLVCITFLILNPMLLFFLDFQLSFALTFALSWFNQLAHIRSYKKSNY